MQMYVREFAFFQSRTKMILKWPKTLHHFGQNVWK